MATALTINRSLVRDLDNAGMRARRVVRITGPASYVTGGVSCAASLFKLGELESFGGGGGALFHSGTAVRLAVWDRTNAKLLFYLPNTGAEVANGVDLSAFTAFVEVAGR